MFKKLILSTAIILCSASTFAYDLCPTMDKRLCDQMGGEYDYNFGTCCLEDIRMIKHSDDIVEVITLSESGPSGHLCDASIPPRQCVAHGGIPVGNLCCYDY